MGLRDDERGQAIQVGAVLLFALLVIAFATYQAVVIPADNERVEFNHNQDVQGQLAELRNAILSTTTAASPQSVTAALGTRYPSRTLGLNPPPPGGSLRTVGTTDPLVNLTIDNAVATNDETDDFWDGDPVPYGTGAIRYSPSYHRYDEAPTTTYEHSVLYNRFSSTNTLVVANQTLIDGNRISIVTLDGSLDRSSSGSTAVDVRPVSRSSETILLEGEAGSPITISFTSLRDGDAWNRTLSGNANVTVSESASPAGSEYHRIQLTLDGDGPYRLGMTKAAVGTGGTDTDTAYLTTVTADSSVRQGENATVTLAVRDAYNNPVSGVTVSAAPGGTASGTLSPAQDTSDVDGVVTFTYEVGENAATGTYPVNFTFEDRAVLTDAFEPNTPANVTANVTVGGASGPNAGSGAYSVAWTDPDGEIVNDGEILNPCDADACTWDVGASGDGELLLNATLSERFEGIDLEFAVTNGTVAELADGQGTTGSNGAATETLTANAKGTLDVLASGNEGSDRIHLNLVNVENDQNPTPEPPTTKNGIRYDGDLGTTESASGIRFDITNVDSSFARINSVKIQGQGSDLEYLYNADGREIEISGGQPTGFATDQEGPGEAYLTDNSSISFKKDAVLTKSGSQTSGTVRIRDFGSRPNPDENSLSEYDFGGLQRVSGSESWDVALTLQFQNRGDIVYFFQEV